MTISNACSRCGGYGLVTGYGGDPTECRTCGGAGVVWPPYCTICSSFASFNYPCKKCARRGARVKVVA